MRSTTRVELEHSSAGVNEGWLQETISPEAKRLNHTPVWLLKNLLFLPARCSVVDNKQHEQINAIWQGRKALYALM